MDKQPVQAGNAPGNAPPDDNEPVQAGNAPGNAPPDDNEPVQAGNAPGNAPADNTVDLQNWFLDNIAWDDDEHVQYDPNLQFGDMQNEINEQPFQADNALLDNNAVNVPAAAFGDIAVNLQAAVESFFPQLPDISFGDHEKAGARLPALPLRRKPLALPVELPRPRRFPSVLRYQAAREMIDNLIDQGVNLGNPAMQLNLVHTKYDLKVGEQFFQRLKDVSRYPITPDDLSDYYGLSKEEVKDHARITDGVLTKRCDSAGYQDWPPTGNNETMMIVVYYTSGFYTLLYARRDITLIQLENMIVSVCNVDGDNFQMFYASQGEYRPLTTDAHWNACNEAFVNEVGG